LISTAQLPGLMGEAFKSWSIVLIGFIWVELQVSLKPEMRKSTIQPEIQKIDRFLVPSIQETIFVFGTHLILIIVTQL
jgi:hypothetical protein